MRKNTAPRRSCLVCRERENKEDLIRVVLSEDGFCFWDKAQKKPGRGAYLHQSLGCLSKANEMKLWSRAFRKDIDADFKDSITVLLKELTDEVVKVIG